MNRKNTMNMKSSHTLKLRVLILTILATASLICVLFAANPNDTCNGRYIYLYSQCAALKDDKGNYVHSIEYCQRRAQNAFNRCMRSFGVSSAQPPPLPTNPRPIIRPPTPVGVAQPPPGKSPPPLTGKPIIHPPVTGPITTKSPSPSPTVTLYAKPKPTPPQHEEHHHH
jgi:hypothetical protein